MLRERGKKDDIFGDRTHKKKKSIMNEKIFSSNVKNKLIHCAKCQTYFLT